MSPLIRYTLLQIPGWILLAALLWFAVSRDWIQPPLAIAIMAVWVLKDAALYPLCKPAFETGPDTGPRGLIGREAEVIDTLSPEGQVRINSERWIARTQTGETITAGQRVRITATDGMVLIVEPVS